MFLLALAIMVSTNGTVWFDFEKKFMANVLFSYLETELNTIDNWDQP